jgi:hypothetical protein
MLGFGGRTMLEEDEEDEDQDDEGEGDRQSTITNEPSITKDGSLTEVHSFSPTRAAGRTRRFQIFL